MNEVHILSTPLISVFNLSLLTDGWIPLSSVIVLAMGTLVFYRFRVSRMKNLYAELSLRLEERNELLTYATANEQKAKDRTVLANRAKSDLLARISREIRTPMNGVIGMASLLAETSLTAEQREYNETVRTCGESLLTVINEILLADVLSDSKVEVAGIELGQKDFDLRDSIEEVLEVFAGKTTGPEIELLYSMDRNVPSHIIGDSQRLRQVLMNLVENSVRFTRRGEIVVKVKLMTGQGEQGLELGFEVCDTGSGIPEDKMSGLFKEQAPVNASTVSKRGAGQPAHRSFSAGGGLTICKKTVGLMGGKIKAESRIGEGTTIQFTIRTRASLQSVRIQPDMAGQEGKRILIVEDNVTSGNLLKEQLELWELAPVVVHSGNEALQILSQSAPFDMVITDWSLPEMNAEELARSIRKLYPQVPVILINGEGDTHEQAGLFDSVVSKPIKQHVICEHILSGLKRHGSALSDELQPVKPKLSSEFSLNHPMRILIAEDNRVNQKLAMKVLCKLGYDPDIAGDGKEVLEIVSNKKYDLILMDVQMPEMDGLEATRMIRLCLDVQPVIIAMTANSMLGDREECMQAGMDDYISKPVRIEELVLLLEKWAEAVKAKL